MPVLSTVFCLHLPRHLPLLQNTPLLLAALALGGAGFAQGKPGSGGECWARAGCCVLGQDGPREGPASSGHSERAFRAKALQDISHLPWQRRWLCCWVWGLLTETVQLSDPEDRRDCSVSLTETGLTLSSMDGLVKLALSRGAGQAVFSAGVPPLSRQLCLLFCHWAAAAGRGHKFPLLSTSCGFCKTPGQEPEQEIFYRVQGAF